MLGRKSAISFFTLFLIVCVSLAQQLSSQSQSTQSSTGDEYTSLVAQAKADLSSGNPAKALDDAQQAEKLDSKRWEAYFLAGTVQRVQKMCSPAVDSFTAALARAPEEAKALIKNVLQEECMQQATVSTGAIHGRIINPTGQPQGGGTVSLSTDGGVTSRYAFPVSETGEYSGEALPGNYMLVYRAANTPPSEMVDSIRGVNIEAGESILQDDDMSRQDYIDRMSPEQRKQFEALMAANAGALRTNAVISQLNADLRAVNQDIKDADGARNTANGQAIEAAKYYDIVTMMTRDTAIKPDQAILWTELATGQRGLKQYDQAIVNYQKAITLEQADKKPAPDVLGGIESGLGECYAREGKVPEANATFDAAVRDDPARASIYLRNEAVIFFQEHNSMAQVAAADEAIKIDPNDAVLYYIKGQGLVQNATIDRRTNRIVLPPGCTEAYKTYLTLAPNGPYARDVQNILQQVDH